MIWFASLFVWLTSEQTLTTIGAPGHLRPSAPERRVYRQR